MPRNRSIPASPLIPELAYADVTAAARWLCDVFGFTERLRIADHRIQLELGTGAMVVTQLRGELSPAHASTHASTHAIMMRVPNADAHYAHAKARGANVGAAPVTYAYGERQYSAVDIGGHHWKFSESVADVDPASWGGELLVDTSRAPVRIGTVVPYLRCDNAAQAIAFYVAVFGAEEVARLVEPGGRIAHAELRLGAAGDASLMLSDEYPEYGLLGPRARGGNPVALQLYVDDVVATLARAVAAGATIVRPAALDPFGDKTAKLLDVCGHEWMVGTRVDNTSADTMQQRFAQMMGA